MAGSVNKVILIGNLGADPEVRRLENGGMLASFSVATSDVFTDKVTGQKKELTDWHDIVTWGKLAEISETYLRKGMKVYVEGKLKKRSWQDKEGNTRFSIEIVAEDLTMLSRNESSIPENGTKIPYSNEGAPEKPSNMGDLSPDPLDNTPF
ncbi:MAG: single-stranded DNA-binding protein [Flavobacteriia bacterium]